MSYSRPHASKISSYKSYYDTGLEASDSNSKPSSKAQNDPTYTNAVFEAYDYDTEPLFEGDKDHLYTPRSSKKRDYDGFLEDGAAPLRQSARTTRHIGTMEEKDIDDIFQTSDDNTTPRQARIVAAAELFAQQEDSDFILEHSAYCEACGLASNDSQLIACQGCSFSYHQDCLGPRSTRQHLVTKVAEERYVLQCKHCSYTSKRGTDPDRAICQECGEPGLGCQPFRLRVTATEEQRARMDNGGVVPVTDVSEQQLNNLEHVLTRCDLCLRAWHFECLPQDDSDDQASDTAWICSMCFEHKSKKVSHIVAWRLIDPEAFGEALEFTSFGEDEKEYLIKFDGDSYFHVAWYPGAWVFKKVTSSTRKAFAKDRPKPKETTSAAVPQDYLAAEIVLAVQYVYGSSKAQACDISLALVKYAGLPYEQAFWDAPPVNSDQMPSFTAAYQNFLERQSIEHRQPSSLARDISHFRQRGFRELSTQSGLMTGSLLPHQIQGMNWLLFKYHHKTNAILGDEMGLGKTIQVIAFMTALKEMIDCFPYLIVVPNSTVPNWKREISTWAPFLKVCTFHGSKKSREMVATYELFPQGSAHIHCHVVVMSYKAAADPNMPAVFKGVHWQALVVDEGQRLKNDESQLYTALRKLPIPFRLLLTGTPLQNNPRELFNLLQFLDPHYQASKLEAQYDVEHLDAKKIEELHSMIRPHFLRRTKEQELKFLPPMKLIKLPVSMTLVQKKVYRTILAKDSELMRAILGGSGTIKPERASLNNIVMQLRKCLAHPFVYSSDIEERMVDAVTAHQNLVEASPKLKLLEQMLPILRAGGHRVLLFSQFLDMLTMLEDFLTSLSLPYQRLDGNISSLEKQRRIDHFNAPGSDDFAFLLSTRAGGVGINLATADTVIILDPDWNPHQDSQALARAHRIGQKNNVLCFKMMTIASVEERIMAIGERKMALDKALIQHIDEHAEQSDLIAVLRHGVKEIFKDASDKDIVYDDSKLAALLDRSHMQTAEASAADNAWSFAEEWRTYAEGEDQLVTLQEWKNIEGGLYKTIQERESKAKEAAKKVKTSGRPRRGPQRNVSYTGFKALEGIDGLEDAVAAPLVVADGADSDFSVGSDVDSPQKDGRKKVEKPAKVSAQPARRGRPPKPVSDLKKSMRVTKPSHAQAAKAPAKQGRPKKSVAFVEESAETEETAVAAEDIDDADQDASGQLDGAAEVDAASTGDSILVQMHW